MAAKTRCPKCGWLSKAGWTVCLWCPVRVFMEEVEGRDD